MSRDTQQASVGREQGAQRFFCKAGGYMNFNDQDFTGAQMRMKFLSDQTITQWGPSGTTLSGTLLSPAYGYHALSLATGMSLASAHLPSVFEVGAVLVIDGTQMAGDANVSVIALSDGIALVDIGSVALSSLEISAAGVAKLVCHVADTWAVVEASASVDSNLAA
jgi:hypothetical protein